MRCKDYYCKSATPVDHNSTSTKVMKQLQNSSDQNLKFRYNYWIKLRSLNPMHLSFFIIFIILLVKVLTTNLMLSYIALVNKLLLVLMNDVIQPVRYTCCKSTFLADAYISHLTENKQNYIYCLARYSSNMWLVKMHLLD